VNKKTGEKVWETPEAGGDTGITSKKFLGSWSTPFIARVGGQEQLIFAVPGKLKGYDPKTGKELWSSSGPGSYCYSSPFVIDDVVVFGQDLLRLGGTGDISKQRFRHRVNSMYISTAVVVGDHLYTYNGVGVPGCQEWKTGKELWKDQIEGRPGGTTAWGSPVHAAGRIYITDQQGSTFVFAAGPRYELLAANHLRERCNASIAIAHGNLFIRTHKHLWCIGEESKPQR
jgi:outer membrane protein assembly factor BamB